MNFDEGETEGARSSSRANIRPGRVMLSLAHGLWVYPLAVAIVVTVLFMRMDGRNRNRRAAENLRRIEREREER